MATNTAATTRLIRRARFAESLTIAWMVVELVVALWAGTEPDGRSVSARLRR